MDILKKVVDKLDYIDPLVKKHTALAKNACTVKEK